MLDLKCLFDTEIVEETALLLVWKGSFQIRKQSGTLAFCSVLTCESGKGINWRSWKWRFALLPMFISQFIIFNCQNYKETHTLLSISTGFSPSSVVILKNYKFTKLDELKVEWNVLQPLLICFCDGRYSIWGGCLSDCCYLKVESTRSYYGQFSVFSLRGIMMYVVFSLSCIICSHLSYTDCCVLNSP